MVEYNYQLSRWLERRKELKGIIESLKRYRAEYMVVKRKFRGKAQWAVFVPK